MDKYRLYYAPNCGAYLPYLYEHQNLKFILERLAELKSSPGKYMIVKKSSHGDEPIYFGYLGKSGYSVTEDSYDLADSPKVKRHVYKGGKK